MAKTTYDFTHEAGGWQAAYDFTETNGPLTLTQDGKVFLENLINSLDGRGMLVVKTRAFRKGGAAVNDTESRFNVTGATGFRQITRYANNVARFTTDVMLKKDTAVKSALEVGSCRLVGKWTRLLTIAMSGEASWQDLQPGELRLPLALVYLFEREDGFRCELATGFDLWRWQLGLEMPQCVETVLTVTEDGVSVRRLLVQAGDEPVLPPPRDYRFCHQLAWSVPSARQSATDVPPLADVSTGSLPPEALTDRPALSVDFRTLPVPTGARVNGEADGDLCWESNAALMAAKKIIRQLAALGPQGRLHIAGGLTPSVCTAGKHVDRPRRETAHWDLNGIVCFAEWVRQTLGPDWVITCAQEGIWAELPSIQCLFGANGFTGE